MITMTKINHDNKLMFTVTYAEVYTHRNAHLLGELSFDEPVILLNVTKYGESIVLTKFGIGVVDSYDIRI